MGVEPMSYSASFMMNPKPWRAPVVIFDDGQCHVRVRQLNPDRPLVIEVEGETPNDIQIQRCCELWHTLSTHFDFVVVSFCPALLPHSRQILAPLVVNIPAA